MKNTAAFLMALGLALPTIALAQDSGDNRPPRRDRPPRVDGADKNAPRRDGAPGQPGGPGGDRAGHRPPPPLFAVLDANRDGVIDEVEINQSPEALRKLDKNGDGKLTLDELRPNRPDDQPDGPPPGARNDNAGPRPHRGPRPPQQSQPSQ